MVKTRATLLDQCYQVALWFAFQGLRIYWFIRRPRDHGTLVLIWFENRVLLVRHSYKAHWSAPGGAMKRTETARDAIVREIAEEIGCVVKSGELRFIHDAEFYYRHRHDRVSLFEWHPLERPSARIDHREIIEARWFALEEARQLRLPPHLIDYFAHSAEAREAGHD